MPESRALQYTQNVTVKPKLYAAEYTYTMKRTSYLCTWRPSRSLRELFVLILVVAGVSVSVTYHVSKHLLRQQDAELSIRFDGRVRIYRDIQQRQPNDRRGLEGIDLDSPNDLDPGVRQGHRSRLRNHNRPATALERKLLQVEDSYAHEPKKQERRAIICHDGGVSDGELDLYQMALVRVQFKVIIANGSESCESQVAMGNPAWDILFCLSSIPFSTHSTVCHNLQLQNHLLPFQKIGSIATLSQLLGSKDSLCSTLTKAQHIPVIRESQLVPPCFILPYQYDEFMSVSQTVGQDVRWVFKPFTPGDRLHLLQPSRSRDLNKIKDLSLQPFVAQQYQGSPLLLFGMPFSLTSYVLVTSLAPLRAYMHSEGIVQFRHDYPRHFEKIPGRTWTLEHLKQHLSQTHGKDAAQAAFTNLENVIVQTLLLTEGTTVKCPQCFHLVAFEVIFNSSFQPLVVEVNISPTLSELSHLWSATAVSNITNAVLVDTMELIFSHSEVALDVAMALEELSHHVGIKDHDCQPYHKLCLTTDDVQYILNARRESMQRGGFLQLYPSYNANRYSALMEDLQKSSLVLNPGLGSRSSGGHSVYELHSVLISLERYYHNLDTVEDSYDDLNIPLFSDGVNSPQGPPKLVQNIFYNSSETEANFMNLKCSEDRTVLPYLLGIYTAPALNITPQFDPSALEYFATVPYETILVKVWGIAQNCDCEARLEDKYGLARPSNYTLGLGSNQITIEVVDVTHTEPWVLNTYTLHIYRQSAGEGLRPFSPDMPHVVCTLTQTCELRLVPGLPCGLQSSSEFRSWHQYVEHSRTLPNCSHGDESGTWIVPCSVDCSDTSTCHWSSAIWQPHSCVHPVLDRTQLKQCLAGKQVLFIGDSTNRGIMHYLMEQANDSLTEWDKTHNIKIYTNLNMEQTTVSFAYYPQFWLPANQRPVFDKALYQLMKKSMPLENNHNTVLVVGGVHWLATHHLNVIAKALEREGLSDIRVIMKSLGAGFHQPVNGLHCLNLRDHRKLLIHNNGLVSAAHKLGFDVVDTFNMTMSRYQDFLQGKCACHFHRVREVLPSFTQFLQTAGQTGDGKLTDMPILYHVEGEINTAYSEMLLNHICDVR